MAEDLLKSLDLFDICKTFDVYFCYIEPPNDFLEQK